MADELSIDGLGGTPTPSTSLGSARPAATANRGLNKLMTLMADYQLSKNIDKLNKLVSEIKTNGSAYGVNSGGRFNDAIKDAADKINENRNPSLNDALTGQGRMGGAISAALQLGSGAIAGMDNRTDAMYARSLSYDKLSMLYQQTQGISQNRFANAVLQPLSQYKLGQGGASTLLALQAQTGLNAQGNAAGIAGLRAATGFAYSTQDMAQMMRTMASPMVNNRMTMTLGTGMYGPGGKQRNMMEVIQQVVKGAGLTNERIVNSGTQIGSVTRARLSAYGVSEDMQDMVLQYAKENIQYKKKGGAGMYDPNNVQAQKLMGIKGNFANQQEETQRVSEARDMQFYKRQNDNYAQLEKNTQGLIKAFGALEDKLSGIIGARISTRNNKGMSIAKGIGGLALMGAGAALSEFGIGIPMMGAGAALTASAFKGYSGDPMPGTTGSGVASTSFDGGGAKSYNKLNPKFKERLAKMMKDNPNVGVVSGARDAGSQQKMFMSRYSKTTENTGIYWQGSYWKKNAGAEPAAPPGFSMHEIGLAADLTGDLDWVQKNAHKYGLKTFGGAHGEPWHIQPNDVPDNRVEYERMGAPWGRNGSPATGKGDYVEGFAKEKRPTGGAFYLSKRGPSTGNVRAAGGGIAGSSAGSGGSIPAKKGSVKMVVDALYAAGFRGADLEAMAGIATRETVGLNPNALNPHGRDMSYGLWQINMKNDDPKNKNMGLQRLKMFGLKNPEELYDPLTNAKAAKTLFDAYKNAGKNPFQPWLGEKSALKLGTSAHRDKSGRKGTYNDYGTGVKLLEQAGYARAKGTHDWVPSKGTPKSGDPMPPTRSGGGGSMVNVEGATITVHAPISIAGGAMVDAAKVAQEASRVIEREVKLAMMRRQ